MNYLTPEFIKELENSKDEEMLETLKNEFKAIFPDRTRILGKENLNLFLTHQQEQAKHYNYLYYDDLKRYALIAFYLGTYFDEDPFYPWVQEIMQEDESFGVKVDALMEEFQKLSKKTLGEDFIYFIEALKEIQKIHFKVIQNFKKYENVVELLKRIYPQRVEALGEDKLYEELKVQKLELIQYNMHNALGACTYLVAKFMLGSHVLKDPLYAWVGKYVNKTYENDQEKSRALFDKGMSRVRKELQTIKKNFEKRGGVNV
jgi:hypothetical protein